MAVTIRDVAEAAGVSPMSVSKVLHDRGTNVRVSDVTATRIREVAEDLGYYANNIARSLRTRKTFTIGLVIKPFSMHGAQSGYFSALISGITSASFEHNYTVSICPRLVKGQIEKAKNDGRFDGIIRGLIGLEDLEREAKRDSEVPMVLMHTKRQSRPNVLNFIADNHHGLELAVAHLFEMGHTNIGFVIDAYNIGTEEGLDRVEGFKNAMTSRGLEPTILLWGEHAEEFYEFTRTPDRQTAIITFSEYLGRRICELAIELEFDIPSQLSLVAFDSTPFCETSHPRLTAISQPIERMAYEATLALLTLINGETPSRQLFVYPCGLDVRDSTARPYLTGEVSKS